MHPKLPISPHNIVLIAAVKTPWSQRRLVHLSNETVFIHGKQYTIYMFVLSPIPIYVPSIFINIKINSEQIYFRRQKRNKDLHKIPIKFML